LQSLSLRRAVSSSRASLLVLCAATLVTTEGTRDVSCGAGGSIN